MLYYDDRDYLDYNNIDELYEDDSYLFEDEDTSGDWEYGYHNVADEITDD